MSSKPAIVFVTGSFCPPSFYDNISTILRSRGYELSIPPLRTVGKKPGPAPTMYDDAAGVAAEVTKFADQGKDVVLIAHSYGGVVASQAVQGLSKKEREQQGKTGGVVRVAYMTALVPDLGAPGPSALSQESTGSEYITVDEDGWMVHHDRSAMAKLAFNHLSPEDGIAWAKKFSEHSAISFANELTYAGYKDVPCSWLFCEDDLCVSAEFQQKGIERIEKASGRKVDVTRGWYDHCPSAEKPEEVVSWIESVVEKGGKENE